MNRFLVLASFSLVVLSGQAQLEQALEDIFLSHELMGMSVSTLCAGEPYNNYHFGLRDFDDALPVNDSTMYRIASISKMFTATALMKLHGEGLFNLEDDISPYLEYLVRNPNHPDLPITFEMVLSHRAGLQDGTGYNGFLNATYASSNPPSISELIVPGGSHYTANMWRQESPGTYFAYSNVCFGLAGTLVEAIAGERFDVYLREEILEPCGIRGSFNVSDLNDIENLAALYRFQNGAWVVQLDEYNGIPPAPADLSGYVPGTNGLRFAPQGGLRASSLELAKFASMHMQQGMYEEESILQASSLMAMHTPVWTYNGSNGDNYFGLFRQWGLGIQQTTNTAMGDIVFDGIPLLGHPGEAYGLISDLYFDPSTGNGFTFLTNGSRYGYAFGNVSAYYTLEEEIFQALEASGLSLCSSGVDELSRAGLSVFPNPCNSRAWLNTTGLADLELLSLQGERLMSFSIAPEGGLFALEIAHLPPGIYLLKGTRSHVPVTTRLIVK